jgi:hypothetical protein
MIAREQRIAAHKNNTCQYHRYTFTHDCSLLSFCQFESKGKIANFVTAELNA